MKKRATKKARFFSRRKRRRRSRKQRGGGKRRKTRKKRGGVPPVMTRRLQKQANYIQSPRRALRASARKFVPALHRVPKRDGNMGYDEEVSDSTEWYLTRNWPPSHRPPNMWFEKQRKAEAYVEAWPTPAENAAWKKRTKSARKKGGGRRPPPPTPHPVDAHGRRIPGAGATAPNKIVVLTMNGQKIEILLDPRTWGEGVTRGGLGPNNIPNQDSVVPFAARDPTAFDEVGSWYKPKWNSEITEAHSIGVLFDLIADKLKKLDDQPIGGFKTEEEGMLPGSLLSIVKRTRPTPRSRYDFLDLRPPQRMAVEPRWRLRKEAIWQHLNGRGLNLLDGEPIYVMIRDPVRLRGTLVRHGRAWAPALMLMRYLGRLIRHRPARGPRASAARNEWADKYDEEAIRIADVAHNQGAPPRRVQIAAVAAHYDELAQGAAQQ
jgi:hypothetical protein